MEWHNFIYVSSEILPLSSHQSPSYLEKTEMFKWIIECQIAWEDIKNKYIQAPILISPNWELEFHVDTNAF